MGACRFEKLAYLYPLGALTPEEKARFEAHMESCDTCRAMAEEVEGIRGMATLLGPQPPLSGLDDRVRYKINERVKKGAQAAQRDFLWRWQKALMPVAAAVCVVLFAAVLFVTPSKRSSISPGIKTSLTAGSDVGKPSNYFVRSGLDKDVQSYLSDDSDAALSSYLNNLASAN